MSEHKKSHIATVLTLSLFALVALAAYAPGALLFAGVGAAAVSLPIVIWNVIRSVF